MKKNRPYYVGLFQPRRNMNLWQPAASTANFLTV